MAQRDAIGETVVNMTQNADDRLLKLTEVAKWLDVQIDTIRE